MRLSGSLNEAADQYAQRLFNMLRCRGRLTHSNTPGQGENLASGWTTADVPEARSVQDAVKSWCVEQYRSFWLQTFINDCFQVFATKTCNSESAGLTLSKIAPCNL